MKFDINAARSSGYSDDEIAEYLATENKFDLSGALKSGYSASDVIGFLSGADAAPAETVTDTGDEAARLAARYKAPEKPGLIQRAASAISSVLPKPVDPMGIASGKPLGAPAARPQEPAKATKEPTPYRDRREALDDAVNLLEEGADQKAVTEAFSKGGIQFDEIVAHGKKRGSEYFKEQPGMEVADPEVTRLANRYPAPVTGEIKSTRPDTPLPGADVLLAGAKGVVGGFKMLMSAGGAGGKPSSTAEKALEIADSYLEGLRSAAAVKDDEEIGRIMDQAKDGTWTEQVVAAAKAAGVAPASLVAQGLGTSVPVILASLLPGVRESTVARLTAQIGLGAAQGAGATKEAIYSAVKEDMLRAGVSKIEAEERAEAAQSYLGQNKDQIAIGMALGALASSTGVEKVIPIGQVSKVLAKSGVSRAVASAEQNVIGRGLIGGVTEAVPEFAQGSAEQVAQNVALQREGRDVPTFQGAVGQGALEAIAGFGAGAVTSAAFGRPQTEAEQLARELDVSIANTDFTSADPVARARLDVNRYDPTLISPEQTTRGVADVGPSAPISFTPVGAPTQQAGLVDIVVPTAPETTDVSTLGATGGQLDLRSPAGSDQLGGGLGIPGLDAAGTGQLRGGDAGLPAADAGANVLAGSAAGQPTPGIALPRVAARATDQDLLARTEAAIAAPENNNAVVEPVQTMTGRSKMGYATEQDATVAMQVGKKRYPDLSWKIEPMEDGRLRVSGYEPKVETPGIAGQKIDEQWTAFAPETGTKAVPRAEMPQIKAEHRGPMVNFLEARGVTAEKQEIPASDLKPTQAEFSQQKVQAAKDYTGGDRSILVSSDNYVLDGHHQWLAKLDANEPVKVIRLNAPIEQLIDTVREFPSATLADGATVTQPAPTVGTTEAGAGTFQPTQAAPVTAAASQAVEPITAPSGAPFSTAQTATVFARQNGITDFTTQPVDGGFVIQPAAVTAPEVEATPAASFASTPAAAEPITAPSGKPFSTEKTAAVFAQQNGITSYSTVKMGGGWVIKPTETTLGTQTPQAIQGQTQGQQAPAIGGAASQGLAGGLQPGDAAQARLPEIAGAAAPGVADNARQLASAQPELGQPLAAGASEGERAAVVGGPLFASKVKSAPISVIKLAQDYTTRQSGVEFAPVSSNSLSEQQRAASLMATLNGQTVTFIEQTAGDERAMPNGLAIGGKHVMIDVKSEDAPLAVAMHEVVHNMPDNIRKPLEGALRNLFKSGMEGDFKREFNYDDADLDKEIPAMITQAVTKRKDFWNELRQEMGNKDFSAVAELIITRLDNWVRGVREEYGDGFISKYVTDVEQARSLIAKAYAQSMREQGLQPTIEVAGNAQPMASNRAADETPEFKKFFGNSKVVSGDGKPLVVYHGTNQDITAFDPRKIGRRDSGFFGSGFYMTANEEEALDYADSAVEDSGEGAANALPLYASLQNPFIWDMSDAGAATTRQALAKMGIRRDTVRGNSAALSNAKERETFNRAVREAGYDGVIVRDEDGVLEVVAFRPEQIKSATDNIGNYDPANPDIRRSNRRGTTAAGDYDVRTMKDGTIVVYGDPEQIRAQVPDDVKGRVTKDGIVFTNAAAPRVRAALEGRQVAYSRGGQVTEKLPMKDGKYLGAPAKFDTPGKIPTLRKILRQLADEGAPGRYWYENSGKAVLKMVGGDVNEARKFVALLAIYSPQAKVDANSTFSLRAWAQYKAGQTISVKTQVMDDKAKAALDDVDAFWSGEKTGNFFFNLLREIDPTTAGKQGATIDMWMMRAGQYDTDAPTGTQYSFMENETNRLAQELGWEPQQVQAAIWVAMKARMENSGVKKMTEKTSEKKGWIKFVPGKDGKGKVRVILDAQKHRDNWLKYSFEHDVTKDDTQQAKFDFGDGLQRHIGQVSFEARPGRTSGVLPGIHSAPYAQQVEFQQAVQKAFFNADGTDELAAYLGLLVDSDILAPGVWQGEISPSTQLGVAMAPAKGAEGKTNVDPAQAKALNIYAAVAGLVARQEGVGWHRPFYASTKRDANGLDIDVGRVLNPREVADLETAVGQWMADNGKAGWQEQFAFVSSPSGIRLVNFGIITNDILQTAIVEVAESVLPDFDYRVFASSGDMPTNNWKENPNGESYVQRIGAEGRPDVLDWARAVLAPRVQRVFDEYSERYGWGDSGKLSFSKRAGDGSGRQGLGGAQDRQVQAPERADAQTVQGLSATDALPGAPTVRGFTGPDPRLVAVAEQYARDKGITLRRQAEYAQVDPERAARIAAAYEAMPHAPNDLRVKAAYKELIAQTLAQYRALEKAGYKFWFINLDKPENAEYASSPWNAMRDIRANKVMGVFPTDDGFGSGDFDPASNPLLEDTGIKWPSGSLFGPRKRVLANDLFRAVHDAFGHGLEGAGFRAQGEENAWQAHVRLFTGAAVAAITSETRGQNSWLNYGPNGENNRTAKVEDTVFADQKTGLMPEWTWTDGRVGDMPMFSKRVAATETPAFRKWFGDSKVVDAEGEPLVVYHGTPYDNQGLFKDMRNGRFNLGFHFGTKQAANDVLDSVRYDYLEGKHVLPVYLSIKNPIEFDIDADRGFHKPSDLYQMIMQKAEKEGVSGVTEDDIDAFYRDEHTYKGKSFTENVNEPEHAQLVKDWITQKLGVDGFKYVNAAEDPGSISWIALEPSQIKSAIGNEGSFDASNPDIRRSNRASTKAPEWVPEKIWRLHELMQRADDEAEGRIPLRENEQGNVPTSGALKRNQTMAFRRLNAAVDEYVGGDYQKSMDLMTRMNEESSRRADEAGDDIRASNRRQKLSTIGQNFTLPSTGKVDSARIKLQDDALRMKRVIEAVKAKGGTVGEAQNFYDANTLMPGRIQATMDDFRDNVMRPLINKAVDFGIDLDELALYAYAKHAKERNAYIASINKRFPDGGSGMTNDHADSILQLAKVSGDEAKFEELHRDLMAITSTTRQVMLAEGLISQDEFNALDGAYENYIPLRGLENVDEKTGAIRPGVGRGINVRGGETIKALGRKSQASDLIENVIRDYQRVIMRVEKNDVGKVLLDFVLSNPDPDLWGVDVERTKPALNKATGLVQYTKNIEKGEDTIGVKVGGEQVYIKLADPELARAIRQAWKDETSGLERATLAMTGWWNNWMRNVLTRYNPAFAAINIPRDALWSGTSAALAELGPKGLAKYLANYGKALMASTRQEAGLSGTANKIIGNQQMDQVFQEFRNAGAITGGFYMRSLDDINKDLRNEMLLAGAKAKNTFEAIKSLPPYKMATLTARMLEFMGSASENATRFALYQAAREVGKTPAQAALLAKDGTTNFNRKGEWGGALNNLYLFFNAAVQGNAQLFKVLKSPAVQASMAGVAGVGMMLALYGASAGGEDDDGEAYWDKVPSYVKERNLVFMLPPGDALADGIERVGKRGRYFTLPVQYGFNIFPNAGYMMADVLRNAQDPKRGVTPTKAALHMTSTVFGSVNPFGGAVDFGDGVQVLLAAMPTLADLPVQLINERGTFGSPSAPEKSSFDVRPDSSRMFTSQMNTVSEKIAKALNELGGGNEAKAGKILGVETSVTPGTIQTLISATTGGLGSFVEQVGSSVIAMTGDDKDLKAAKIPFLNKFYGEVDESANIRGAGDRMREIKKLADEVKAQQKIGLDPELDSDEERLLGLASMQESYQKFQTQLRKSEIAIIKDDKMTEAEKKLQRRQIQVERDRLATEVNREYLKSLK